MSPGSSRVLDALLFFKHSDTKWDTKNILHRAFGGGGAPVMSPFGFATEAHSPAPNYFGTLEIVSDAYQCTLLKPKRH